MSITRSFLPPVVMSLVSSKILTQDPQAAFHCFFLLGFWVYLRSGNVRWPKRDSSSSSSIWLLLKGVYFSHSYVFFSPTDCSLLPLKVNCFYKIILFLTDEWCYGIWIAMGVFCQSRHLWVIFRSKSCTWCIERVSIHLFRPRSRVQYSVATNT